MTTYETFFSGAVRELHAVRDPDLGPTGSGPRSESENSVVVGSESGLRSIHKFYLRLDSHYISNLKIELLTPLTIDFLLVF